MCWSLALFSNTRRYHARQRKEIVWIVKDVRLSAAAQPDVNCLHFLASIQRW